MPPHNVDVGDSAAFWGPGRCSGTIQLAWPGPADDGIDGIAACDGPTTLLAANDATTVIMSACACRPADRIVGRFIDGPDRRPNDDARNRCRTVDARQDCGRARRLQCSLIDDRGWRWQGVVRLIRRVRRPFRCRQIGRHRHPASR